MGFITVSTKYYLFAALWAILGNIGFGASYVLLNAFLPVLVRHHPKLVYEEPLVRATTTISVRSPDSDEDQSLLAYQEPLYGDGRTSGALALSTQISGIGIAVGYTAAVILQIFAIVLVLLTGSTTWSLQLVLFSIGAWWLIFTIPTAVWLEPRPGPPLPPLPRPALNGSPPGPTSLVVDDRSWWGYVKYAWVGLGKTIMRARRLKDVMLFLAAWFLVSDGVATVSGTAVLFAKTVRRITPLRNRAIHVILTDHTIEPQNETGRPSSYICYINDIRSRRSLRLAKNSPNIQQNPQPDNPDMYPSLRVHPVIRPTRFHSGCPALWHRRTNQPCGNVRPRRGLRICARRGKRVLP